MKNIKLGLNPHTNREFLLLNVSKDRKLTYSGTSYQTRYGADRAKKSDQIIVRADLLPDKIKNWKLQQKVNSDKIFSLESKYSEASKNPEASMLADSLKEEISRLRRLQMYDYSALLK